MRTLKKVLALTIALATLFSLTAFAAYKDESVIASETMSAVNLVNSLKIMTGDTKGNFNPTATITRAEAAKMVYVVRTGGNTDATGWKGQNVFTDTKGHWAEGFINYCASVGIIAGVGNNKFNPEGKLTGVELAKMLLVAAGYKADIQGYTGSAWQSKVLADAENAGLFNNYAPAYVGAAPRQYAAVMFSNCLLRTNMAVYLSGELVNGAIGTQVLVGAKYFGLATKTGIISDVKAESFKLDGGPAISFKGANADLTLQNVTVVCKMNGTVIDAVYDVYASGKSKVYNVKDDEVSLKEVTADKEYTLAFPGYDKATYKELGASGKVEIAVYQTKTGLSKTYTLMSELRNNITKKYTNDALRFIDQDGDGVIDAVIHFNGEYVLVAKNNSTDGFQGNGAINVAKADYSKINFIDSVVKNDVAHVYYNIAGVICVEKVEAVKGTFTAMSGTTYTIGGVKYDYADNFVKDNNDALTTAAFGDDFNVYTDGAYAVAIIPYTAAAAESFSENLAIVTAIAPVSALDSRVQVLLANGETKVFEYSKLSGDLALSKIAVENVYQYTLKDGKISMRAPVEPTGGKYVGTGVASAAYDKSKNLVTIDAVSARANANTYFFVKYNTNSAKPLEDAVYKYAVVKASEMNTFAASDIKVADSEFGYVTTKGIATLAFGFVNFDKGNLPGGSKSDDKYAIVTGAYVESYVNGETVITVPVVYMDGTKGDLVLADKPGTDIPGVDADTLGVVKYTVIDGEATLEANDLKAEKLNGVADTFVKLDTAFVDFASSYNVFYLDKDGEIVADGKLYVKDTTDTTKNFTCYAIKNTTSKITTLFVTGYVAE